MDKYRNAVMTLLELTRLKWYITGYAGDEECEEDFNNIAEGVKWVSEKDDIDGDIMKQLILLMEIRAKHQGSDDDES